MKTHTAFGSITNGCVYQVSYMEFLKASGIDRTYSMFGESYWHEFIN